MADFYVDATSGRDEVDRGLSAGEALRSITFAVAEAVRRFGVSPSTLHIAEGIYARSSGEVFPILVPQNISLIGADTERTLLLFERDAGDAYELCLQGGGEISGMTFQGDPLIPGACDSTSAILLREDGTHIHDIAIRESSRVAEGDTGFGKGIEIEGVDARIEEATFLRCSTGISFYNGGRPVVQQCRFDLNGRGIDGGFAEGEIRNNDFETGNNIGMSISSPSLMSIVMNRFHSPVIGIVVDREEGRSGTERPSISGNEFEVGTCGIVFDNGDAFAQSNRFRIQSHGANAVTLGAELRRSTDEAVSPVLRDNEIIKVVTEPLLYHQPLIKIHGRYTPLLQENRFSIEGVLTFYTMIQIRHDAVPDLGGGLLGSIGQNRFAGGWMVIYSDEGSSSREIFARNNFWRHVPPIRGFDAYGPGDYYSDPRGAAVRVYTEGARLL